ncbi:MAG: hypothetical protein OHK0039_45520 [Bacteroidia bacterium]
MGMDNYRDVGARGNPADLNRRLHMLAGLAQMHGKVPAFTETGQERIPNTDWWPRVLLGHIRADEQASRVAYVVVWRNARPSHCYAPYPGHPSVSDFVKFTEAPRVLLEDELPRLYRRP